MNVDKVVECKETVCCGIDKAEKDRRTGSGEGRKKREGEGETERERGRD